MVTKALYFGISVMLLLKCAVRMIVLSVILISVCYQRMLTLLQEGCEKRLNYHLNVNVYIGLMERYDVIR